MKRPLAYITAAWCGEPDTDMELAARYCRMAYEAGFSPICPILYLPLFINDAVPGEHKDGIDMRRDLLRRSHVLVVCGGEVDEDVKNDISIESQIDFCKYELKGGSCRIFKDKGYSGKNTDRPEFQKLLGEIRKGKVRRVVVYKLDRISRSILDFANMMELFQEYDVEFVSSTEKFDTSTPMGRAMLNICIVFAQLERKTIQKRVTDAYYSRCLKGFHMSGQAPYGFDLEPTVVENIRTKMMVADPIAADHVRLMFEMYAEPRLPSEILPGTLRNRVSRYMGSH